MLIFVSSTTKEKNMRFAALLLCTLSAATAYGQAPTTTEAPRHVPYVGLSGNYTPGAPVSYTTEAGSWGTTSNTSYAAVFDAVPLNGDTAYFIGAKLYYTVHSEPTLSYMVYVAPKARLDTRQGLLEYGFNPNYTINKRSLLGVTVGQQVAASGTSVFGLLGLIYFLRK